jgi:hypothetical protein
MRGPALSGLGGFERLTLWRTCKDGWVVGYTTTPLVGGTHPGKFAVVAYKPIGKGARTGKPETWEVSYVRCYARRRLARDRAKVLWQKHEHRP